MTESPAATRLSTRRLVVQAVLRTDVGKVRSENQDFAALTTVKEEAVSPEGGHLLIVADGMRAHRGGATASRIATQTVTNQNLRRENTDVTVALHKGILRSTHRVFSQS